MTLQERIDKALLEENQRPRGTSGKWSPSFFGRCIRAHYWKRKGEPPTNPPDVRSLKIFKCGKLFHDFVQKFYDKAQTEVKAETDDIFGYADIVLEDEIIDIKSIHSRSFWHMNKPSFDFVKEKLPNLLQIMCYCWILNKPKGRLVYVSKDDLCINEYVFHLNKSRDMLQAELDLLRHYWDKDQLPPALPRAYKSTKFKDKECEKYCPYRDKCYELEKNNEHIKNS